MFDLTLESHRRKARKERGKQTRRAGLFDVLCIPRFTRVGPESIILLLVGGKRNPRWIWVPRFGDMRQISQKLDHFERTPDSLSKAMVTFEFSTWVYEQ